MMDTNMEKMRLHPVCVDTNILSRMFIQKLDDMKPKRAADLLHALEALCDLESIDLVPHKRPWKSF